MVKNYFITAFRNVLRNKAFSLINVLGLSIGISAALVIFLIVYHEFSFDKFEPDHDRIYRVVLDAKFNGVDGHSSGVHAPLANAAQNETTGVQLIVPVMQFQGDASAKVSLVKKDESAPVVFKKQADIIFTNPQYFTLLPYRWLAGSPRASLQSPFAVVLSQSRAQQYFPSLSVSDIVGKQIAYNDDITATVTGVVEDMHQNTSFTSKEFISYATLIQTHLQDDFMMTVWTDWMAYSQLYIKLADGSNGQTAEKQLTALLYKYNPKLKGDAANKISYHLQPLSDVHFNGLYPGVGMRLADKPALYGLLIIAAFLLLLGCINFINLTTANATHRAKEIGIRKTMGSSRRQLILQFLGETFFITAIATFLSACITPFLLTAFSDFTPPGLHFDLFQQPVVFLFLFLLTLLISFLSGLYPALILSGYKPVLVLKSQFYKSGKETLQAWVRKTLTVSQFVIAQFFVIATLFVSRQINYSLSADLGFNKDGIITFEVPHDTVSSHTSQLLHAIGAIPEVEVAGSGFLSPSDEGVAFTNAFYAPKKNVQVQVQFRWGNPSYLDVYKLKLLAGTNVAPGDTMKEFLINDTYAKLLGFQKPQDAIGRQLTFNKKLMPIVGVIRDFHDQSMHQPIYPLIFAGANGSTFHVRFKEGPNQAIVWKNGLAKVQKAYRQMYPDADFDYKFYDETIASMYQSEQRMSGLLSWATGLAIFISCLGLLGLVMYTINTRAKEIGIRKILGATVTNIVFVLSADFVKLVSLAFLIAVPIAWWAICKWLQNFTYRTDMSLWMFLASGVFTLLIALFTLSIQTIKAAVANPVKSLRTE